MKTYEEAKQAMLKMAEFMESNKEAHEEADKLLRDMADELSFLVGKAAEQLGLPYTPQAAELLSASIGGAALTAIVKIKWPQAFELGADTPTTAIPLDILRAFEKDKES